MRNRSSNGVGAALVPSTSALGALIPANYGVVGDGTTDDTAGLTAALNAALASGSVLDLPTGTYLIQSPITITGSAGTDQHLRVRSSGTATIKMGASFPLTVSAVMIKVRNVDSVDFDGVDFHGNRVALGIDSHYNEAGAVNRYIGGLTIDTAAKHARVCNSLYRELIGDCIDFVACTNVRCYNNEFRNSLASAIYTSGYCVDVDVRHNKVYGIGVALSGTDTKIGSVAILDNFGTRVTVAYNHVFDSPDSAMKSDGGNQVSYIGNQIDGYGKDGIKILNYPTFTGPQVFDGLIEGNTIKRPLDGRSDGGRAIEFVGVSRGVICNNVCTGGTKSVYYEAGITLLNGNNDCEIFGNVCDFFADYALESTVSSTNTTPNQRVRFHHNRVGAHCQAIDGGEIEFSDNVIIGPTPLAAVTTDGLLIRRCDKVRVNRNDVQNFNRGLWVEPDSATTLVEICGNNWSNFGDKAIILRNQTLVAATVASLRINDNTFAGSGSVTSVNSVVNPSNKDCTWTSIEFMRNRIVSGTATVCIFLLSDETVGVTFFPRLVAYDNWNDAGILQILAGTTMVTSLRTFDPLTKIGTFGEDHGLYAGIPAKGGVTAQFDTLTLANNVTNPNFQMDAAATSILVVNSSGVSHKLDTMAFTVDITVTGLNGLETGFSEVADKTYYVYCIYNPTTGAHGGILSENSNPAVVTLPSGYTYWGLVGAVRNVSSNFRVMSQEGRVVSITESTFVSNVAPTSANTLQSAAISHLCPDGSRLCWGNMGTTSTTIVPRQRIAVNAAGIGSQMNVAAATGATVLNSFAQCVPWGPLQVTAAKTLYWSAQDNTNAVNRLTVTGYSW